MTVRVTAHNHLPTDANVICDGSSLPFLDGFESGDCSVWSAMVP